MTQRVWVSAAGAYLGTFDGGNDAAPPEAAAMPPGAVRVAVAPAHVAQLWDGTKWTGAIPVTRTDDEALRAALIKKGVLSAAEIDAEKVK